jgi:hypothetical protein
METFPEAIIPIPLAERKLPLRHPFISAVTAPRMRSGREENNEYK